MGILDSFGTLVSSIIASIVLLIFAVVSFFIVQVGAGLAGYAPSGDFVVLSAAILATGSIVAGATPMSSLSGIQS
jgi:hypothetical protein